MATEAQGDWVLVPRRRKTTLAKCPIGLFEKDGEICLKTEYGNNEGRIDAYIVSSGEFFWGDAPQTIENQRRQRVTPIRVAVAAPANPLLADLVAKCLEWARADAVTAGKPITVELENVWDEMLKAARALGRALLAQKGERR